MVISKVSEISYFTEIQKILTNLSCNFLKTIKDSIQVNKNIKQTKIKIKMVFFKFTHTKITNTVDTFSLKYI